MPAEQPWIALSQVAAAYYFAHFLIILPLVSKLEKPRPLPHSISESVLHGESKESRPYGLAPSGPTTVPQPAE
jgi:ubiquinol-cytochrome c reductase cytochrome b subunit